MMLYNTSVLAVHEAGEARRFAVSAMRRRQLTGTFERSMVVYHIFDISPPKTGRATSPHPADNATGRPLLELHGMFRLTSHPRKYPSEHRDRRHCTR
jgi:hypothetical protein